MTFTEILLFLDKGYAVRRKEYANELIIFKQTFTTVYSKDG